MRTNQKRRELITELKKSGKTQAEIARELGCSKATVSYYCGNRTINPKEICQCGSKKRQIAKVCQTCRAEQRKKQRLYSGDMTLGDKTYTKHKYAKFAYIRYHARSLMCFDLKINTCQNCGYDKHIEVCHIKPISSYPEDTKLDDINHLSNLLALCPNCHWEFDNNLLTLSDINGADGI